MDGQGAGPPVSGAVRPRLSLRQPVVSRPLLVVGGGGGPPAGRTSRAAEGGAALALVAVVGPAGGPVLIGAAVVPLAPRVEALPLEGAPVALENLSTRVRVRHVLRLRTSSGGVGVGGADSPACLVVGGFHSGGFGSERGQRVEEEERWSPAGPAR